MEREANQDDGFQGMSFQEIIQMKKKAEEEERKEKENKEKEQKEREVIKKKLEDQKK